jgi:hypothetical protein
MALERPQAQIRTTTFFNLAFPPLARGVMRPLFAA